MFSIMFLLLLRFLLLLLYVTVIIKIINSYNLFLKIRTVNIMARFTMIKPFVLYFQQVWIFMKT